MLISPKQLYEVLKEETPRAVSDGRSDVRKGDLSKLLDNANLTAPEVFEHVALLMRGAETESVRMKAAEIGLKLNGFLQADDETKRDFNVTIVINDIDHTGVNPILIPR